MLLTPPLVGLKETEAGSSFKNLEIASLNNNNDSFVSIEVDMHTFLREALLLLFLGLKDLARNKLVSATTDDRKDIISNL